MVEGGGGNLFSSPPGGGHSRGPSCGTKSSSCKGPEIVHKVGAPSRRGKGAPIRRKKYRTLGVPCKGRRPGKKERNPRDSREGECRD